MVKVAELPAVANKVAGWRLCVLAVETTTMLTEEVLDLKQDSLGRRWDGLIQLVIPGEPKETEDAATNLVKEVENELGTKLFLRPVLELNLFVKQELFPLERVGDTSLKRCEVKLPDGACERA